MDVFEDLKIKLKITWEDESTNDRLTQILSSAGPTLIFKLGLPADFDFTIPGIERSLFLNYCMYEWNDCINDFDNNYQNEILQIRMKHGVNYHEKEKQLQSRNCQHI